MTITKIIQNRKSRFESYCKFTKMPTELYKHKSYNLTVNLPKCLLELYKHNIQQNVQSYCKTASGTPVQITANVVYVVTAHRTAV